MAKPPIIQDAVAGAAPRVVISTVEMHTTGEPTRIIYSGFPALHGYTLLEKRADAKTNHDHVRRQLILEPRGHREMYGALIVNETEFTLNGEADVGVLFMHNDGWSTMCGHATIALGRFLVDFDHEVCVDVWPTRALKLDEETMTTKIKLHCPCGNVNLTVPVKQGNQGKLTSDLERNVSFVNVECFATGVDESIYLTPASQWPQLAGQATVNVDFCYGGAFYCIVDIKELGFSTLRSPDIEALSYATRKLKAAIIAEPSLRKYFQHPVEKDLGFLYGIMVTEKLEDSEIGLCFFGDQQVDRSPTGSGVAARRALGHAKRTMKFGEKVVYHSPVSWDHGGEGAFIAHVVGEPVWHGGERESVRVQVEGRAFYTGYTTFLVEQGDAIGNAGFLM